MRKQGGRGAAQRPGRTQKVSISLDRADLRALRRRADTRYGGNLSAAIAEGARRIREEEGREALLGWLGDVAEATPEQLDAIRSEWQGAAPRARRRRAA
ncbi:MAG: hypothetical protein HYY06_04730 [Deltaproteobacteria bacterium]|nr:hypothetical protein [Deltaproteobacteria bacterium]